MKDQNEVQLAWKMIELLEAFTDLIWNHYHDDFILTDLMETLKTEDECAQ
jgi:hypothetical protein